MDIFEIVLPNLGLRDICFAAKADSCLTSIEAGKVPERDQRHCKKSAAYFVRIGFAGAGGAPLTSAESGILAPTVNRVMS